MNYMWGVIILSVLCNSSSLVVLFWPLSNRKRLFNVKMFWNGITGAVFGVLELPKEGKRRSRVCVVQGFPMIGESQEFVGEKSIDVTWYLDWMELERNSGGKADGFCTCSSGEDDALKHEDETAQKWFQESNQQHPDSVRSQSRSACNLTELMKNEEDKWQH